MTEQVFLFGKVLEIDEALKNGIKLRMYMMEVGKQVQLMVKSTFDVANNIYEWLEIGNGVVDGFYLYEVRHDDDCQGNPVEVKRWIMVNFLGTLLLKEPIEEVECKG